MRPPVMVGEAHALNLLPKPHLLTRICSGCSKPFAVVAGRDNDWRILCAKCKWRK